MPVSDRRPSASATRALARLFASRGIHRYRTGRTATAACRACSSRPRSSGLRGSRSPASCCATTRASSRTSTPESPSSAACRSPATTARYSAALTLARPISPGAGHRGAAGQVEDVGDGGRARIAARAAVAPEHRRVQALAPLLLSRRLSQPSPLGVASRASGPARPASSSLLPHGSILAARPVLPSWTSRLDPGAILARGMQLLLVRHAEAASGTPDELRPLTPTGREQARSLGERLRAEGVEPSAILTSPLLRARETGELLARELGADTAVDERSAPGATPSGWPRRRPNAAAPSSPSPTSPTALASRRR